MFIKVTTASGRRYAQLVESFRNEAGQPRQRTLASLGPLESGGQVDRLIQALQRAQGRDADAPSPDPAPLQLEFLTSRSAGDVWALWHRTYSPVPLRAAGRRPFPREGSAARRRRCAAGGRLTPWRKPQGPSSGAGRR